MNGQQYETVLAELRPSRLLSSQYYILMFLLLAGAVSSLLGYIPGSFFWLRLTLDGLRQPGCALVLRILGI